MKSLKDFLLLILTFSSLNLGAQTLLMNNYPNVNGWIYSMVVDTNQKKLYIGGNFTQVGDSLRNNLACIDSIGRVTTWNPNINGVVYSITFNGSNSILYVGGNFDTANGLPRKNLASFYTNLNTNIITTWNPQANNQVNALVSGSLGNIIYAAGLFDSINGIDRNGLAAIDPHFNFITPWNPILSKNGIIIRNGIIAKNNQLFVAGTFDTINNIKRSKLASFDEITGNLTAWNPEVTGSMHSMYILDSNIFITGIFNSINGQTRNGIASINRFTGQTTNWNPNITNSLTNTMYSLSFYNDKFYTGCASVNWTQANIVAIDRFTGAIDSLTSVTGGGMWVFNVLPTKNSLYIGGGFTNAGGQPKTNLAVFSNFNMVPVKWLSLKGNLSNDKVNLSWTVTNEKNNSHFEIERSIDKESFYVIGSLKGKGTQHTINIYQFADDINNIKLNGSSVYYRIRQYDLNGKNSESEIIAIQHENSLDELLIYPNPATNKIIIKGIKSGSAEIVDIYNRVYKRVFNDGEYSIDYLPKGLYFVRYQNSKGKLVIQ